ncbi:hypothetical protein AB0G35_33135 [Streptomyces sp. NPDC021749]|uniref:hypothetical protein n=1 Tax=Streptomyces sp. NPDC021749 TaxID=3154905 RepID=UPI0033E52A77
MNGPTAGPAPGTREQLAGADTVHGLRGAARDGGTWDLRRGWTTHYAPAPVAAQR